MAQILVIDDEPASRELLVTLLGYHSYHVVAARDGAEGLTYARATPPELIVTDILMPELDGYTLVTRVRADPALAHIPIIFATAIDLGAEVRQLAAGVAQIVIKPIDLETLLAAVLAALVGTPPVAISSATAELDQASAPPDRHAVSDGRSAEGRASGAHTGRGVSANRIGRAHQG